MARAFFAQESFAPQEYLESRKGWSHASMRSELVQLDEELRSELVELVNGNYAEFLDLSVKLLGVESTLNGAEFPLRRLRARLGEVDGGFSELGAQIAAGLDARRLLHEQKAVLRLFLDVQRRHDKLAEAVDGCSLYKCFASGRGHIQETDQNPSLSYLERTSSAWRSNLADCGTPPQRAGSIPL
jgi:hypothetical protein